MTPASCALAVTLLAEAATPWLTPRRALVGAVLTVVGAIALLALHSVSTPIRPRPGPRRIDADELALDAVSVLESIQDAESDDERRLSALHRILARTLALPFSDYVRFLRHHDYVTLDVATQSLALSPKGSDATQHDDVPELLRSELERHFADVLARGVAVQHGETEERRRLALELER